MPQRRSTLFVGLASLAFTYLFFAEYLSPFRKVYVPFDLWGYHYPLMDYAFQCLRRFSFPAWDPSIYCGEPFAANIQAALFYPPSWILFALAAAHKYLPYRPLEAFLFAHIWLGFLLFFCWLRSKRLSGLASILGAGIFAFSGYAMLQLQHQGLLCGYIWLPLRQLQSCHARKFRRYAITTDNGPLAASLKTDPMFELVGPVGYYFQVYRYKKSTEPFAFDGEAQVARWTSEIRGFKLAASEDSDFVLREQFFPGWTASLDGRAIPISLWRGVFQRVRIPSGDHLLEFRYQPRSLQIGAWISVLTVLALAGVSIRRRFFHAVDHEHLDRALP